MGTDQTKSDYMCLEIKYDYSAVVPNIYALVHGVKHCSSDAQCPSSYCQHPGPSGECHTCGDACCLTDKDCPGSYCANDPTKMPPYFCHGGNTALEEVAPAAPFCLHAEDVIDHKCFEACNADGKKFASKGITTAGKCPAKYSTIDKVKTVEQCPDGVTNLRYCQATKLNVTISTKGQAGLVAQMEQPGTSVYCKDNGFCHVPPLPAQCTKNSDCVTPWYSSWCMNDASKHAPYVCKEMLPPKCKTDKDCERK